MDVPENVKLSLKKRNHALPLGSMAMDRSSTFNLPATPNNNRLLNLASSLLVDASSKVATYNSVPALLVGSGVTWVGELYVDKVAGGDYSVVFTFGDLVPLRSFLAANARETNTISEVRKQWYSVNTTAGMQNSTQWGAKAIPEGTTPIGSTENDMQVLLYGYTNFSGMLGNYHYPSTNLKYLLERGASLFGILPRGTIPELIASAPKFPLIDAVAKFWQVRSTNSTTGNKEIRTNIHVEDYVSYNDRRTITAYWYDSIADYQNGNEHVATIYGQYSTKKTTLKMPKNLPSDLFLVSVGWSSRPGLNTPQSAIKFYGGYSFKYDWSATPIIEGSPLAGKDVDLPAVNDYWYSEDDTNKQHPNHNIIFFVRATDYIYLWQETASAWQELGLSPSPNISLTNAYTIGWSQGELDFGESINAMYNVYYRLSDLLPDSTYYQIMCAVAVAKGLCLDFRPLAGTKRFGFLKYDLVSHVVDLTDKLISVDELSTGVLDLPESVVFGFDYNERVPDDAKSNRTINTLNIDKSVKKINVPFSTATNDEDNADVHDIVADSEAVSGYVSADGKNHTLMQLINGIGVGVYASVDGIFRQIASKSQKVKVKVKLSAFELDRLDDFAVIQLNGQRYYWQEITWSEGVATMTLQKI
ncbi:MAG: hypothetical protein U0L66_08255 [Acutalibacteraceae bacterium]|nr:hypothetical protein [Acutalibacteraceae bacterium]